MSSLDDRLPGGYVMPDQKDMHVHVCACGQIATTRFMTGKEWYERFEKEAEELSYLIRGGDDVVYIVRDNVLKAARKASGIYD